ncbi:unnamed protein product [Protopolystoma xenopodis]|uniref:Uncharacterized protein n=1 Tax=Protopolystoma xenopodis TaxID=117903 RepID=A0A3S4ZNR7_9PLAT|nr:unnamed protein product [Protopolystoma xenopodis]
MWLLAPLLAWKKASPRDDKGPPFSDVPASTALSARPVGLWLEEEAPENRTQLVALSARTHEAGLLQTRPERLGRTNEAALYAHTHTHFLSHNCQSNNQRGHASAPTSPPPSTAHIGGVNSTICWYSPTHAMFTCAGWHSVSPCFVRIGPDRQWQMRLTYDRVALHSIRQGPTKRCQVDCLRNGLGNLT